MWGREQLVSRDWVLVDPPVYSKHGKIHFVYLQTE